MESQVAVTNGSNPSDDEKAVVEHKFSPHTSGLPPDPDAHLSKEERAAIVSS
jgi:hypothetical protein